MAVLTRRLIIAAILPTLLLTACGAPAATQMPDLLPLMVTITNTPGKKLPQPQRATPLASPTAAPAFTLTPELTDTPELTETPAGPAPTDTLLPQLLLPTEKPNAPALNAWTGLPTYAGDSQPGRLFRLDYDPGIWAQTEGNFGGIVLAHRQIDYCTISPWSGRGLPPDAQVQHEFRLVGTVPYDVNTVSMGGDVKFVAYVGGDKNLLTGFQVSFQDQKEQCLQDAEVTLATLRSFVAQPTISPTGTMTPSVTP